MVNPLHTGNPQTGTFTNSEETHYAAFHQGLHRLLKALSHYNVLANVCQRMKYLSSTLTYAEI